MFCIAQAIGLGLNPGKMNLPFTAEQFADVFRQYNEVVFPAQVLFTLTSAIAIFIAIIGIPTAGKIISLMP